MKNQIYITTEEDMESKEVPFVFDYKIANNLYYVNYNKKININIGKFNIKKQLPKGKSDIGVKFSKIKNFVIVTICFPSRAQLQFLVNEKTNKINIEFLVMKDFREVLNYAVDLAKAVTLSDLYEISDNGRFN